MNNPMEIIGRFMGMINGNPMLSNAMRLAKEGDRAGVERIARNLCKAQGRDFDREFNKFMSSMH